jgi:hypothetical protein
LRQGEVAGLDRDADIIQAALLDGSWIVRLLAGADDCRLLAIDQNEERFCLKRADVKDSIEVRTILREPRVEFVDHVVFRWRSTS